MKIRIWDAHPEGVKDFNPYLEMSCVIHVSKFNIGIILDRYWFTYVDNIN